MIPLVLLLLRSRNVLDRWTDMFERNTIMATLSITMTARTKEEAILGLSQSIQEISKPLQEYLDSRKTSLNEFLDVSIHNNNNLIFDVLLDADHVLNDGSSSASNNLKNVLKEYGAIIIKIVDGDIDGNLVRLFIDSLIKYNSVTKHPIGMGLVIGDSLTDDAREYANKISFHRTRGIGQLILIAKPSSSAASRPPQHASVT
jgi:hypothetical protein